jgi:hypothetical protein
MSRCACFDLFTLAVLGAVLSGCFAGSSPPSRFYTLSSLKEANGAPAQAASAGPSRIVAVGPVQVPDYLDRPEIVTSSGDNEYILNEFHRWSGSLESCISRALMEDVSVLVPPREFSVVRWSPSQTDIPIAYRIMVDVARFDASPGGSALLDADWAIYGNNKEMVLMRKFRVSEKVTGTDFTFVAAAMSKAVEDLSRDIAAGVVELERKAAVPTAK